MNTTAISEFLFLQSKQAKWKKKSNYNPEKASNTLTLRTCGPRIKANDTTSWCAHRHLKKHARYRLAETFSNISNPEYQNVNDLHVHRNMTTGLLSLCFCTRVFLSGATYQQQAHSLFSTFADGSVAYVSARLKNYFFPIVGTWKPFGFISSLVPDLVPGAEFK